MARVHSWRSPTGCARRTPGDAAGQQLAHPGHALFLEADVADAQHLVDDQHVGIEMGGDREAGPRVHPGGVALDRRVDEFLDPGEIDDRVELAGDLAARHPHDRALQVDVLAAGQVRVEPGGDLDQGADPAVDLDAPARRPQDLGQQLERRRLAGAVRADDAERLAGADLEREVADRPEFLVGERLRVRRAVHGALEKRRDEVAEAVVPFAAAELLGDAFEDDGTHQRFSAKSNSARWKVTQAIPSSATEAAKVIAKAVPGIR
jgi:hypothetical protein